MSSIRLRLLPDAEPGEDPVQHRIARGAAREILQRPQSVPQVGHHVLVPQASFQGPEGAEDAHYAALYQRLAFECRVEMDATRLEQVKALLGEAKPTLLAFDDTTFYSRLVSGEFQPVWTRYIGLDSE